MPPLKSCKVLSLENALLFAKQCKYLSKSSNHFWFIPIMKLVLSMLKKMSREKNFKKVTKIFLRLLNERSRELKVMMIRKSKYYRNLKSQGALKEDKSFQIMHLIEQFPNTKKKNTQAVNKVECLKCKKGP